MTNYEAYLIWVEKQEILNHHKEFLDNEGKNFVHHDSISVKIARNRLGALKFSSADIKTVVGLIKAHMRIGFYVSGAPEKPLVEGSSIPKNRGSRKAFRKTLRKFDELGVDWRDFVRLRIADNNANRGQSPYTLSEIRALAEAWKIPAEAPVPTKITSLAVSGGELIEFFNLTPGPIVGELHRYLLNFVTEQGPEANTRESLLCEAGAYLGVTEDAEILKKLAEEE